MNILGADGGGTTGSANDIHVSNIQTGSNGLVTQATVELRLHASPVQISENLNFNLGLPAMPFHVITTGGLSVQVGFDYELAFTFDTTTWPCISLNSQAKLSDHSPLPAHQLDFSVGAQFAPNTTLTAELGFLYGTLQPTGNNSLNASVYVDGLTSGSPSASFGGSAYVNLLATLSIGSGSDAFSAFPSISTTFSMTWSDLTQSPDQLSYGDLKLNLGSFFSNLVEPILSKIQEYTEPLQSAINFLNAPIPGIDAIPELGNFSLNTVLNAAANVTGYGPIAQIVDKVEQFMTLVNSFSTSTNGVSMDMGTFKLNGSAIYNDTQQANDPSVLLNTAVTARATSTSRTWPAMRNWQSLNSAASSLASSAGWDCRPSRRPR